jgi:sulfate-transporting ATPase
VNTFIQFGLLGLGVGALYALVGLGVVVVYRGSGVVNFAAGAFSALGGYVFLELHTNRGVPAVPALLAAVLASGALGALVQVAVMRPLSKASALTRVIATTALLTAMVEAGLLLYGPTPQFVDQYLPAADRFISLSGNIVLPWPRVELFGIAVVGTLVLWVVYRFSRFGLATTAVAENDLASGAVGISPNYVAMINWSAGCAMAGLAGALIAPIVSLSPESSSLIIIPALAAALIGRFRSFPLTLAGGLFVGVVESELTEYVSAPGWSQSASFLIIAALLVISGRSLPARGHLLERLPAVGFPRLRARGVAIGLAVGLVVIGASPSAADPMSTSMAWGFIGLSIVVVVGYAGQLSLAQFALAGAGAFVASRLSASLSVPFLPAAIAGVAGAGVLGLLLGFPAVRTRGINLAIGTLGLGFAFESIVLGNQGFTGGIDGTVVRSPSILGFNFDGLNHPQRFAIVSLVCLMVACLAVANLRRGRVGRRLVAVRSNERAAAALGVNVRAVKLFAFTTAAAIAGFGGVLLAYHDPHVQFDVFDVLGSISALVLTVLGGAGFIIGGVFSGVLNPAGIGTYAINQTVGSGNYVLLASSLLLLFGLILNPDGLVPLCLRVVRRQRFSSAPDIGRTWAPDAPPEAGDRSAVVVPRRLEAEDVTVRFGGVTALHGVSLSVASGEVVGVVGPNGAGKTTLIDAISGFVPGHGGSITLGDKTLTGLPPHARARAGLARSFQSLELFDDLTVGENILVASEPPSATAYITDFVSPGTPSPSRIARAAVDALGLQDVLDVKPLELSAGRRRLMGMARAVASGPSFLLLDEPAAGLDEHETRELGVTIRRLADEWGLGIVLVEHDFSLVQSICDRLIVLEGGRVLAEGRTEAVVAREDVIEAFIGPTISTASPVAVGSSERGA